MPNGVEKSRCAPLLVLAAAAGLALAGSARADGTAGFARRIRPHFDHAPVISGPFAAPQDVTRRCL